MKQQAIGSKDPYIRSSAKALRRASRRSRELGLQIGTPVYDQSKIVCPATASLNQTVRRRREDVILSCDLPEHGLARGDIATVTVLHISKHCIVPKLSSWTSFT